MKNKLNEEIKQQLSENYIQKLETEIHSNDIYELILVSYGLAQQKETSFIDALGKKRAAITFGKGKTTLTSIDYPEYYGGAYVDESGELVVNFFGTKHYAKKKLKEIIGHSDGYKLKPVRYSYSYLLKQKEILDDLLQSYKKKTLLKFVNSYGIDDQKNSLIIRVRSFDEENISNLKKEFTDFEHIIFQFGECDVEQTDVNPGRQITGSHGGNSTVSFRAFRGGTSGFVISGHAARNAGGNFHEFRIGGTTVGRVATWMVSGQVDSAFCNATNNAVLNRTVWQNGVTLPGTTGTILQNATVVMAGQLSGIQSGIITNTNDTSTNNESGTLNGVRASYTSAGGDSGAPIYRPSGNQGNIVGIHARSNGFFVRIAPTVQQFGLLLW